MRRLGTATLLCLLNKLRSGRDADQSRRELVETTSESKLTAFLELASYDDHYWEPLAGLLTFKDFDLQNVYDTVPHEYKTIKAMVERVDDQKVLSKLVSPGVISRNSELLNAIITNQFSPEYPIFTSSFRGLKDYNLCVGLINLLASSDTCLRSLEDLGWLGDCLVVAATNPDTLALTRMVLLSEFLMEPNFIPKIASYHIPSEPPLV